MPPRLESESRPVSRIRALLRRLPGAKNLATCYRHLIDPLQRERSRLLRRYSDRVYQLGGRTAPDRYPHLFAALRDQLEDEPAPRILSFGCSSGDEVLSLRHYLPRAVLSGIDVNRVRLRQACQKVHDPRIRLTVAASIAEAGGGIFDAIVCLSVLHRSPLLHDWPTDCRPHMTFASFERAILDFDSHLAPGGLLLLYHTSFRFMETKAACRYTPLYLVDPLSHDLNKHYDRDNQPILEPREERFGLYRKEI